LGKYLTTLTTSLTKATNREPSIKRKRIHILYILNDLLHHCKYLVNDASISSKIQPTLVALVGSAASFTKCPKHQRKIQDLLDIWQDKGYYSKEYIEKLRETAKIASENGEYLEQTTSSGENGEQGLPSKTSKSAPFVMPAMHGDPSMPWFDLPAGNLMPHIVPNSTRPINPDMIKPLQFVAGPADENLIIAVKSLLDDVDSIFDTPSGQDERAALDIDELGQPIILDEVTGEIIDGEGYYGWSRVFCEKMKRRRKGLDQPVSERDRRSQSGSISPQRKRRYSDSGDSRRSSPNRSRRLRRSYSNTSRSSSPDYDRRAQGDGHSRSRSRSRRQDYGDNEPGNSSSGSPQRSVGNGNQPMPESYPRSAPFSVPQGGFPSTTTYPGSSGMPLPQGLYQPNFHPGFPQPSPVHNQGPMPWPPPPLLLCQICHSIRRIHNGLHHLHRIFRRIFNNLKVFHLVAHRLGNRQFKETKGEVTTKDGAIPPMGDKEEAAGETIGGEVGDEHFMGARALRTIDSEAYEKISSQVALQNPHASSSNSEVGFHVRK